MEQVVGNQDLLKLIFGHADADTRTQMSYVSRPFKAAVDAVNKTVPALEHNQRVQQVWSRRETAHQRAQKKLFGREHVIVAFFLVPFLLGAALVVIGMDQHAKLLKAIGGALVGVGLLSIPYHIWTHVRSSDTTQLHDEERQSLEKRFVKLKDEDTPLLTRTSIPQTFTPSWFSGAGMG